MVRPDPRPAYLARARAAMRAAADQYSEPPEGIADAAVRYGTQYKETTAS